LGFYFLSGATTNRYGFSAQWDRGCWFFEPLSQRSSDNARDESDVKRLSQASRVQRVQRRTARRCDRLQPNWRATKHPGAANAIAAGRVSTLSRRTQETKNLGR